MAKVKVFVLLSAGALATFVTIVTVQWNQYADAKHQYQENIDSIIVAKQPKIARYLKLVDACRVVERGAARTSCVQSVIVAVDEPDRIEVEVWLGMRNFWSMDIVMPPGLGKWRPWGLEPPMLAWPARSVTKIILHDPLSDSAMTTKNPPQQLKDAEQFKLSRSTVPTM